MPNCKFTYSRDYAKTLALVSSDIELANRLFAVEFLGSTTNDLLVTLIYHHKKLEDSWNTKSKRFRKKKKLNIKVMGRSRKQKLIISTDTINESFNYKP